MSIILGIDYGNKRIGLALSDPEEKLARRFFTLINSPEVISNLEKIVKDERVEKIVIGFPVGFSGKSEQTRRVEEFIVIFQENIKIPVIKVNEVLTSKMAEKNLRQNGVKNIKEILDQEAARIILQDYLDFPHEL
ncbi:MAG: Holliday junction resolvase RuvX [Patescibacteria group bacterium]